MLNFNRYFNYFLTDRSQRSSVKSFSRELNHCHDYTHYFSVPHPPPSEVIFCTITYATTTTIIQFNGQKGRYLNRESTPKHCSLRTGLSLKKRSFYMIFSCLDLDNMLYLVRVIDHILLKLGFLWF